jgi:hypothetical protein
MSAGAFTLSKYKCDAQNGGYVLTCRVQPETLAASIALTANAAPSGAINAPGSATVSQGKRSAGVNMRTVSLAWSGAPPTGYSVNRTVRIPVLDPETYAAWEVGATGTYLGAGVQVVGRSPETVR